MVNTSVLSFLSISIFKFFTVQLVFPQAIYEERSKFQDKFTEQLKSSLCAENVQKGEIRLYQCENLLQDRGNELSECKSIVKKLKDVLKGNRTLTADDLCRSIPNFVFEDSDLCPFFYNCSKTGFYHQQCPYPQLFSDISLRCNDPSTVSCGTRSKTYGYTCDFENVPESSCFLANSADDTFDWTRYMGSTTSIDTGPSSAYHGKYYTYIETSTYAQGAKAVLKSVKTFQERTYCLNLFYHMYGSDIGNLTIKTEHNSNQQTVLRQISGNQGNMWQRMDGLDILLNEDTKILIEATQGKSFRGDISIDLITLSPLACPKS